VRGIYCLLIRCKRPRSIKIGKLGEVKFRVGRYLYIGSALNGIEKRVSRYLKKDKKIFWHIDYLLASDYIHIEHIYCLETSKKFECLLSKEIQNFATPVKGFGCSDCDCMSHLFYVPEEVIFEINNFLFQNIHVSKYFSCQRFLSKVLLDI